MDVFSIPKALIFDALFFWAVAGSAQTLNSIRDASGLNQMVRPSVQRYGAKCDSNGTAGNGTDDSAAFLTAAAATGNREGFAVLATCRIAQTLTINVPITFGSTGALVSGTATSRSRDPEAHLLVTGPVCSPARRVARSR